MRYITFVHVYYIIICTHVANNYSLWLTHLDFMLLDTLLVDQPIIIWLSPTFYFYLFIFLKDAFTHK